MNERVESILEHMLEDAEDVISFANEVSTLETFTKDVKTRKAIVMSLLNIGELANQLPHEYKNVHSDIPWKSMIGMRNFAAHGYHTMSLETIWATTQTSVPVLLEFLKSQFSMTNGNGEINESEA
jgi:uncharacterized protein with HEPN domain